ncbi:MAG: hypothetical protein QM751_11175 [Paludibacteraceae bacterium]
MPISGAINIITRGVESKKLKADGSVQLGNASVKQANTGVSFGLGNKLKVRLSGNYSYFERFQDDFYVFDYNQRYPADEIKGMMLPTGTYVEEHFDDVSPA